MRFLCFPFISTLFVLVLARGVCAQDAGVPLSPASGGASELLYDHDEPYVLNEFAMRDIRDGKFASAAILLERATLIAPHDERIKRNLDALRAYRNGRVAAAQTLPEAGMPSIATPAQDMASKQGDEPNVRLWAIK